MKTISQRLDADFSGLRGAQEMIRASLAKCVTCVSAGDSILGLVVLVQPYRCSRFQTYSMLFFNKAPSGIMNKEMPEAKHVGIDLNRNSTRPFSADLLQRIEKPTPLSTRKKHRNKNHHNRLTWTIWVW